MNSVYSYAKAIIQICKSSHDTEKWKRFIEHLSIICANDHVISFINDPRISVNDKISLLANLLSNFDALSDQELFLIRLLLKNKMIGETTHLLTAYKNLLFEQSVTCQAVVCSSKNLSSKELEVIKKICEKKFKKTVQLEFRIDSHIKGIKIQLGSYRFDFTANEIAQFICHNIRKR